jgi:two-component sensor histidine kinase
MNHRVKNTLMTVQALAFQTRRSTRGDPENFHSAFMGRLDTLARSHDLLIASGGLYATIGAALNAGLAPWLEPGSDVIRLAVTSDFEISARQAQVLIMAMHEMGTNAAKYGALSSSGGRVTVECHLNSDGWAILNWLETGGPVLAGKPSRRGFGSRLLEVLLPYELGRGAVMARHFDAAGLRACVRFLPMAPTAPASAQSHGARTA